MQGMRLGPVSLATFSGEWLAIHEQSCIVRLKELRTQCSCLVLMAEKIPTHHGLCPGAENQFGDELLTAFCRTMCEVRTLY